MQRQTREYILRQNLIVKSKLTYQEKNGSSPQVWFILVTYT